MPPRKPADGCAAVVALVAFLAFPNHPPAPVAQAAPPTAVSLPYEIISDAELLALVSDRPLFIVMNEETPGATDRIVTFDY